MNIVVISDNYPSNRTPNRGAFVYNLVQELSYHHSITVIAPFKAHDLLKSKYKGGYGVERCKVYRPLYFSFGNKKILGIDVRKWGSFSRNMSVDQCLNKLPFKPDLIYSHFIYNGVSALPYLKKHSTPLVIASGESSYSELLTRLHQQIQDLKDYTNHFICVSEKNKNGLIDSGFDEARMSVIPNAVDYSLFKPLDKDTCKEKLGIPKHKFVVGFVGHFIHRKGPNRIIEAIMQLADNNIQLVCAGGKEDLTPNNFTKAIPPVPNYQLPEIYNAFDIFVLPTLNEGHCNAIEEAKACCIPIVSSLGTSVEMQVDNSIGILINPLKTNEIAEAIRELKNNSLLRQSMAESLKLKRGEYALKNRALKISSILEHVTKEQNKILSTRMTSINN